MAIITREMLRAIRADIDAALVTVAEKYELKSLTTGSATFGSSHFTIKLDGVSVGGKTKEAERYESPSAKFLGLPPLGTYFKSAGHMYKTAGLNSTGSKVLCDRDDGKTYLIPIDNCIALCAVMEQKGKTKKT